MSALLARGSNSFTPPHARVHALICACSARAANRSLPATRIPPSPPRPRPPSPPRTIPTKNHSFWGVFCQQRNLWSDLRKIISLKDASVTRGTLVFFRSRLPPPLPLPFLPPLYPLLLRSHHSTSPPIRKKEKEKEKKRNGRIFKVWYCTCIVHIHRPYFPPSAMLWRERV